MYRLSKNFKILTFFPHHGASVSGGERSFFEILKRWANWGNQIHIVTTREGYSLLKKQELKFHPYLYEFPEKAFGFSWYIAVIKAIRKIPHGNFDFVYSNEPFTSVIPAFIGKHKTGSPLVIVFKALEPCESSLISCFRNYRAFKQHTTLGSAIESACVLLRNTLAKRADLLFVVSGFYKDLLAKIGMDPKRIYRIRHGVNFDHISSIGASDSNIFDACFMGGFLPKKGIFDLVKAWRNVVNSKPDAKLAMIGTGSKEIVDRLHSLVKELGLENNVIETGWLDDEKYSVMKRSRVFVFPSYAEGFALAVCEAMACGLPVVAYDLAAYKNTYKKGMIKVRTGDVQELANAIIGILEDETSRKNLGRDAIEQAKDYDWENSARAQLDIITKFVQITKQNRMHKGLYI